MIAYVKLIFSAKKNTIKKKFFLLRTGGKSIIYGIILSTGQKTDTGLEKAGKKRVWLKVTTLYTNPINQINLLRQALKPYLQWHGARLNFLALFLVALLRVKTVNLTELATGFRSTVQLESNAGLSPHRLQSRLERIRVRKGYSVFLAILIWTIF